MGEEQGGGKSGPRRGGGFSRLDLVTPAGGSVRPLLALMHELTPNYKGQGGKRERD